MNKSATAVATNTPVPNTRLWNEWESQFPARGNDNDKLRFLLRYSVLAPSNHNSQPWIWEVTKGHADLYTDFNRALPVSDPQGRELVMSCGAALLHLQLALRHFGYIGEVELLPRAKTLQPDSNLLARVSLGGTCPPDAQSDLLFHAIMLRHTNRSMFLDTPLPASLKQKLQEDAMSEGAWLHLIEDSLQRTELIDLIAQGDVMQWHEREFRREQAGWIRPHQSKEGDGILGNAIGLGRLAARLAPVALPLLNVAESQSNKDWFLAGSAPVIAVLGTNLNDLLDWIEAGQALARILLRTSTAGVVASFFNGPVEIGALRPHLLEAMRHTGSLQDHPQLIFRLGYPTEEAILTPRRPVNEVTTTNASLHELAEYFRHSH